ncbi:lipase family protein [Endozoicomonas numazuensis]|uniref:Uncharacterized protein n=1 Tax=Endozoicomonas numazuensis TaxID=1137799 RepID=A0A081NHN2_9GAMM|nr:hypothetical protein [Endozoicomonas numazuensis]KEQ17955.1 hypothetical protein GZ78_10075 [Endozoicomonas numazuensis]
MTIETSVYAQLALHVYKTNESNTIVLQDGWQMDGKRVIDEESDFIGAVYTNGTEVVIAFSGTDNVLNDTIVANAPLATGAYSQQLEQAVDLYFATKAKYPDANISFTGHSLGGGLASLMAVLFDKPAQVFDPANFENSAYSQQAMLQLHEYMVNSGYINADPAYNEYWEHLNTAYSEFNGDGTLTRSHAPAWECIRVPSMSHSLGVKVPCPAR